MRPRSSRFYFNVVFIAMLQCHASNAGTPVIASSLITNSTGGIRGTLLDTAGHPVVGAQILCTHQDGRVYVSVSDSHGQFRVGLLPPARYSLDFVKPGFWLTGCKNLRVKATQWLLPRGNWMFLNHSNTSGLKEGSLANRDHEIYECPNGQATIFTHEDLEKLPL